MFTIIPNFFFLNVKYFMSFSKYSITNIQYSKKHEKGEMENSYKCFFDSLQLHTFFSKMVGFLINNEGKRFVLSLFFSLFCFVLPAKQHCQFGPIFFNEKKIEKENFQKTSLKIFLWWKTPFTSPPPLEFVGWLATRKERNEKSHQLKGGFLAHQRCRSLTTL